MRNPATVNWMEMAAGTGIAPHFETNFRGVIRFIAGMDGLSRCQAAATLVFTLWQVAGNAWGERPPSLLLIHDGPDPLDALARTASGFRPEDPAEGQPYISAANPSLKHMRRLAEARDATKLRTPAAMPAFLATHGTEWLRAKANNFGSGRSGRICRRLDEILGVVTDDSGDIILRIEKPDDVARFRDDLLNHPERLTAPRGRGERMELGFKTVMVSGTISPEQLDHKLVNAIVNIGMPFHVVPHNVVTLRSVPRYLGVVAQNFSVKWGQHRANPSDLSRVHPYAGSFGPCLTAIESCLRTRLRHFPASYDFSIFKTFRELPTVCAEITRFLQEGNDDEDAGALAKDLINLTALSLLIGTKSLAFHGFGFDPGCKQSVLGPLLAYVRSKGTTTRRDIQRKLQKLDAASLAIVLDNLASEGLVMCDGTKVSALTFDSFVAALWLNTNDLVPELATPKLVKEWGPPRAS
jgi:hypothetical protein